MLLCDKKIANDRQKSRFTVIFVNCVFFARSLVFFPLNFLLSFVNFCARAAFLCFRSPRSFANKDSRLLIKIGVVRLWSGDGGQCHLGLMELRVARS
jgi:hypothetical protein